MTAAQIMVPLRPARTAGSLGALTRHEIRRYITSPLFLTGLVLSLQRFRLTSSLVAAVVVSNVLQPLLCLAIVLVAHMPWDVARLTILCCALPSGFFGILFAVNYGRSTAEVGSIVLASTAVSAATLTVALVLLFPG